MAIPDNQNIYMVYQTDLNPDGQGGGVRYVQELVAYLLKSGWTVSFLGAGSFKGKEHPNLGFYRMCPLDASWPIFLLGVSIFLLRNRDLPRGIFHVHRGYFAIPFLLLKPKVPIVCTLHGDTLLVLGGKSRFLRWLVSPFFRLVELFALRRIDRIISVDERTADKFLQRYPYAWLKNKIKIVPSAVDVERFSPGDRQAARQYFGFEPEDEMVLFVGRLARIKNIPFLLRVFAKIEPSRPQARLLLAGDGDVRQALEQYAKKLGLSRVDFMGVVAHQDMPKLMQAADVLALCSQSEASPIVVKEAVACGLPVVTTDVGDVRLVIKNKEQGTIADADEFAFRQALLETLADVSRKKKNQKKGVPTLRQDFAAEKMHEKIIAVYKDQLTAL